MRLSGPQRLALAVLIQGLRDFSTPEQTANSHSEVYAGRAERIGAQLWVRDKGSDVCSFKWCCHAIGLHAGKLRQRVLKLWREDPATLRATIDRLEINFGAQTDRDFGASSRVRQGGKRAAFAGRHATLSHGSQYRLLARSSEQTAISAVARPENGP